MRSITVAICTHNPHRALLDWALSSLAAQTLPRERFCVLLVDNASDPPVEPEGVVRAGLPVEIVREPRPGVVFARRAAIKHSPTPLIAFLDDDNYFAPDYLAAAVRIAEAQPQVGAFGGKAHPILPRPGEPWLKAMLPFLGTRDYGPHPIVSDRNEWGEWEPIGAGLVIRREVGEEFVRMVEKHHRAHRLGRRGKILMSGEDALLARCAYRLGLSCAYHPELGLWHYMKPHRLAFRHVARTMYGHGRSHVVLERVLDRDVPRPSLYAASRELLHRFRFRTRRNGVLAGVAHWFWDVGYFQEARSGWDPPDHR